MTVFYSISLSISLQLPRYLSKPNERLGCPLWHQINLDSSSQPSNLQSKCSSAYNQHFSAIELKQIITTNFFSILYYNWEIWHLPTLLPIHPQCKAKFASSVSKCLELYYAREISNIWHNLNAQANPEQVSIYKLALQLHKNWNMRQPSLDWLYLNENICKNSSQFSETLSASNTKIGNNSKS